MEHILIPEFCTLIYLKAFLFTLPCCNDPTDLERIEKGYSVAWITLIDCHYFILRVAERVNTEQDERSLLAAMAPVQSR